MSKESMWWDNSWGPVSGCTPISEGCENCFARAIYHRFKKDFSVKLHPERLDIPSKLRKPRRVFVDSASDLFHTDVPLSFISDVIVKMVHYPHHTYYVCTKRADRMAEVLKGWTPHPSIWFGVTAENQARADERIPLLLQTPAAHRFVSVEPMLGQIHLDRIHVGRSLNTVPLDWIVCGPETGRKARPCDLKWIKDLHAQCKVAGIPFWDKRKNPLSREQP